MIRKVMKKITFNNIKWKVCYEKVAKLQEKIVVAWKENNYKLVKALQNTLTSSFEARALAVKKVISNNGGNTPGVDGEIWNTQEKRTKAIFELKRKPYIAKPTKRIYIPKANGKLRPLSIPTMGDRAKQALYLMSLDPIAEETSDIRSYGFRKYRSCHDAIEYLFILLGNTSRPRYILEADIKGFFDNISHKWIVENIPMDKETLKKWLKAGHIEGYKYNYTEGGVPQGGIISPTIANMVLNGLEKSIKESVKSFPKNNKPKVNIVRYADDFVVTGASKEILKNNVIPAIQTFLSGRGLELNMGKTKISTITEGFNFLGFNIRKYKDPYRKQKEILLIKPSKDSIKRIKLKLKEVLKTYSKASAYVVISKLNPILRGWGNYYKTVVSKRAYTHISKYLWEILWNWATKKHKNKNARHIKELYFKKIDKRNWVFAGNTEEGKIVPLFDITSIKIVKHTLCKEYNHYLKENKEYFLKRVNKEIKSSTNFNDLHLRLLRKTKGLCLVCEMPITAIEEKEIHHIQPRNLEGSDKISNLLLLHKACHHNVTYNKNISTQAIYLKKGIIKPK